MPNHLPNDPNLPDTQLLRHIADRMRRFGGPATLDPKGAPVLEAAASWRTLLARMTADIQRSPRRAVRAPFSSPRVWATGSFIAIAAIVVGLTLHRTDNNRPAATPFIPGISYATGVGERAAITLSDGSRIHLAPMTRLVLSHEFGSKNRVVSVTGEAYFNVGHAAKMPFVVQTRRVSTLVLGTAFDVKYDPTNNLVRVAVTEGKVAVRPRLNAGSSVTAVAGTVVQVIDSLAITQKSEDVREYSGWTTGKLVFRGATVAELLNTLSAWYGYEFRLADSSLAQVKVNAVVQFTTTNALFLALQEMLGVDVVVDHKIVTLRPRRTARLAPAVRRESDRMFSTPKEAGR